MLGSGNPFYPGGHHAQRVLVPVTGAPKIATVLGFAKAPLRNS